MVVACTHEFGFANTAAHAWRTTIFHAIAKLDPA